MSTHENLLRQYSEAQSELEKAEENLRLVEQRHGGGSGNVIPGQPISYLDIEHPEVQEAWERVERAKGNVDALRRKLWE